MKAGATSLLTTAWLMAMTGLLHAQTALFTNTTRLTNREILLRLNAPAGQPYRIDSSTNLIQWHPLLTLSSTGLNQHADSATPYLDRRFYRAQQLTGTTNITGDYLTTTNGDVLIHPVRHASIVFLWNGTVIYNDPDTFSTPVSLYTGLPKAHLILIGHEHGDHFDMPQLNLVTNLNSIIIAPQVVYDQMSLQLRALTTVLTNGMSTNVLGMRIEAVPAYNSNHPRGRGNGYVVTIGGRRVYMAGDTGPSPEMRVLPNIDVAFIPMNLTFTMSTTQAVEVVRAMRPKVIYPYHYSGSPVPDFNWFKQQVSNDLAIEVRIRNWYPNTP
jgi:L-ascorbate metabolism protein UlaG (beta-lactamase superfamily)